MDVNNWGCRKHLTGHITVGDGVR